MLKLKIMYHDNLMPRLIKKGDWIDLRIVDIYNLPSIREKKDDNGDTIGWIVYEGDTIHANLGISIELPDKYEAIVAPRSSLFKKHGLILTNSIGIIDNDYKGDNDIWQAYLYKLTKGESIIKKYERILQFRIVKNMESLYLLEVNRLGNKNRGGIGSTGKI